MVLDILIPGLAVLGVLGLLVVGWRKTQQRHEAMTLLALGEVHRCAGAWAAAEAFYHASGEVGVGMPEARVGLEAIRDRSTEPMSDHPLVEDVERRMSHDREGLVAWLEKRGYGALAGRIREER